MAKKRKKKSGSGGQGSSKPKKKKQRRPGPPPGMPDMSQIFGMLEQMFGDESDQPLSPAEELVEQAYDAPTAEQAHALARQALHLDPECVDAYLVMGDKAATPGEALQFYHQGRELAGELLDEDFEDLVGQFWDFPETQAYFKAQLGIADALWGMGDREQAVKEYEECLRLNEEDNHGLRYHLAACLLELNRDGDLEKLLQRYEDEGSAAWAYSRALLKFRREGDTEAARAELREAVKVNRHVPAFLVGNQQLPDAPPAFTQPGAESEAVEFLSSFFPAWRYTPGAIPWVRKTLDLPVGSDTEGPIRAPRPVKLDDEDDYPLDQNAVWEADIRRMDSLRQSVGSDTVYAVIVVEADTGELRALDLVSYSATETDLWEIIQQAIRNPENGEPGRPGVIRVRTKTRQKRLEKRLEKIGIQITVDPEMSVIEALAPRFEQLLGHISSQGPAESLGSPAELPQEPGEVWQMDLGRLPMWVEQDGGMNRPAVLLAVSDADAPIVGQQMGGETISFPEVEGFLRKVMHQPLVGSPHRPAVIQFRQADWREPLEPLLESWEIQPVYTEELPLWDEVYTDLCETFSADEGGPAPQCRMPGIRPEQLERFYTTAYDYYQAAPWKRVSWTEILKVSTADLESQPWHGVVMGQSGIQLGIALYDDLDFLRSQLRGELGAEAAGRRTSALSLTYGENFTLQPEDVAAVEKHGWPVAGPEAWPSVMRVNPGPSVRAALNWELALLEGAMAGLLQMLKQNKKPTEYLVPLDGRTIRLLLSWERL